MGRLIESLTVFARFGATGIEAEHDEVFVTTIEPLDDIAHRFVLDAGWSEQDGDRRWYHLYV